MKVCFAGDVFLGGDLLDQPCSGIVKSNMFISADVRVVNLEQPISNSRYVEDKCTLYTGSFATEQLKHLKIDAVNLAHNHIQDKGLDGIYETIQHLQFDDILHFGAGKNLEQAKVPAWLNDEIAVLGYCEFDKPYLRQIEIAGENKPGVNPLRLENIRQDLDALPKGKKAILYFHWGMEHVWLPPASDIELAKMLLEDERVLTIIGMHPHRVQGMIEHAGKRAYMCLGNFIFPNFYISSPTQIVNPSEDEKSRVKYTTRQYHPVNELTYKKWRFVNRVSLIVEFCTESYHVQHKFVVQNDNFPEIEDLKGFGLFLYRMWFALLSKIYKLPNYLYKPVWKLHALQVQKAWRAGIIFFNLRQLGFLKFSYKVMNYVKRKK